MSSFRIDVADLLSNARARRTVRLAEPVEDLVGSAAAIVDPVAVDLDLERIPEGIVARGRVSATWRGDCSRCLGPLTHLVDVDVEGAGEGPEAAAAVTVPGGRHQPSGDDPLGDALQVEVDHDGIHDRRGRADEVLDGLGETDGAPGPGGAEQVGDVDTEARH
jgi:hypothetical protein